MQFLLFSFVIAVAMLSSVTSQNIVGTCDNSNCSQGQICVLKKVQCITAPCDPVEECVDETRPGSCPQQEGFGICVVLCQGDAFCPGNQKCCGGCPKKCQNPV